jgi:hypothetical protein
MFKGLKTKAIHTELESLYGREALARPAVKKLRRHFHQRKTDLFNDPRSERPLMKDLAGVIGSILEERPFSSYKVLYRHFRIGKATRLRVLHDKLGLKNSIFARHRMPYRSTRRGKEIDIRSSF